MSILLVILLLAFLRLLLHLNRANQVKDINEEINAYLQDFLNDPPVSEKALVEYEFLIQKYLNLDILSLLKFKNFTVTTESLLALWRSEYNEKVNKQ